MSSLSEAGRATISKIEPAVTSAVHSIENAAAHILPHHTDGTAVRSTGAARPAAFTWMWTRTVVTSHVHVRLSKAERNAAGGSSTSGARESEDSVSVLQQLAADYLNRATDFVQSNSSAMVIGVSGAAFIAAILYASSRRG